MGFEESLLRKESMFLISKMLDPPQWSAIQNWPATPLYHVVPPL